LRNKKYNILKKCEKRNTGRSIEGHKKNKLQKEKEETRNAEKKKFGRITA